MASRARRRVILGAGALLAVALALVGWRFVGPSEEISSDSPRTVHTERRPNDPWNRPEDQTRSSKASGAEQEPEGEPAELGELDEASGAGDRVVPGPAGDAVAFDLVASATPLPPEGPGLTAPSFSRDGRSLAANTVPAARVWVLHDPVKGVWSPVLGEGTARGHTWLADGRLVVALDGRLYAWKTGESGVTRVVSEGDEPGEIHSPVANRAGTQVAWVAKTQVNGGDIHTWDPEAGTIRAVTQSSKSEDEPSWGARYLVFETDSGVVQVDPRTHRVQQTAGEPGNARNPFMLGGSLAWFQRRADQWDVWILEGEEARVMAYGARLPTGPVSVHDGMVWLAPAADTGELWAARADGSGRVYATGRAGVSDPAVQWSRAGLRVAFSAVGSQGQRTIYVATVPQG